MLKNVFAKRFLKILRLFSFNSWKTTVAVTWCTQKSKKRSENWLISANKIHKMIKNWKLSFLCHKLQTQRFKKWIFHQKIIEYFWRLTLYFFFHKKSGKVQYFEFFKFFIVSSGLILLNKERFGVFLYQFIVFLWVAFSNVEFFAWKLLRPYCNKVTEISYHFKILQIQF